jgi:hypothetical protein
MAGLPVAAHSMITLNIETRCRGKIRQYRKILSGPEGIPGLHCEIRTTAFIVTRCFLTQSTRWLPMPAVTVPRQFTIKQVPDIPLHLIPKTIAEQIKERRSPVYRITVTMAFKNRFTLVTETRTRGYRRFAQPAGHTPDPAGHEGIHSGRENH